MTEYKTLTEVARARYKLACDEMDRLTASNPGAAWRWSIPANPDHDSDLILSASAEDVPRLADAVEALIAERDALRAQLDSMTTEWGVDYEGHDDRPPLYPADTEASARDYAKAREAASSSFRFAVKRRLVGPWVEVTD